MQGISYLLHRHVSTMTFKIFKTCEQSYDIIKHFSRAGPWLQEHTDLRDTLNEQLDVEKLRSLTKELQTRIESSGRTQPIPRLSDRALLRLEKERAKRQRVEEQLKEDGVAITPEVKFDPGKGDWHITIAGICSFCQALCHACKPQIVH